MDDPRFAKFLSIASVALGAMTGFFIAVPIALGTPSLTLPVLILFTLLGALLGYRKRASRMFLYVSLIASVTLASLVARSF
jgi:hypothetical protein